MNFGAEFLWCELKSRPLKWCPACTCHQCDQSSHSSMDIQYSTVHHLTQDTSPDTWLSWLPHDSHACYEFSSKRSRHLQLERVHKHSNVTYKVLTTFRTGVRYLKVFLLDMLHPAFFSKKAFLSELLFCHRLSTMRPYWSGGVCHWVCSIYARWRHCQYKLIGECALGVQLWISRTYPAWKR